MRRVSNVEVVERVSGRAAAWFVLRESEFRRASGHPGERAQGVSKHRVAYEVQRFGAASYGAGVRDERVHHRDVGVFRVVACKFFILFIFLNLIDFIVFFNEFFQCSQSCGRGTQTRKALCVQGSSNLADTSCNNVTKAPDETRACKSIQCSAVDDEAHCLKDKAHLCQVARRDLTVKCRNVVFRKRCCHSCRGK